MTRTLSAFAAAALIALSAPAQADESASFSGSGASQFFGFEIDYAGLLTGSVVSSFSGQSGYDITSVTVDGIAFPDLLPLVGADYFEFKLDVAPGLHTIAIKGLPRGGSFVGSYSVVPVPEADAWVMGLAGLGAAGFVVSRRKRRA
jgi:hypothetical protein